MTPITQISQAATRLLAGDVLAYPTEAVWGLGCDPENEDATLRLLAVKERPVDKGLILIAGSLAQVAHLLAPLTEQQRQTLWATWPGPTTWLVPDSRNLVPRWIKGDHDSVALRLTAHPLAAQLCLAFGRPLVSTSANLAGHPAARTAEEVLTQLGSRIDGLVVGELGQEARPSRIIDLVSGVTLR